MTDKVESEPELTEDERVEAAALAVEAENEDAPSVEDVEKLNEPPAVEPIFGGDGSTVEGVIISKWVVGDDGRPTVVTEEN